jgi:hypothetical protein
MYRDPDFVAEMQVWMMVGREIAKAKRLDQPEPIVTRRVVIDVPYTPLMPTFVKRPGRSARKRKEREEREAAAKAAAENTNGSADATAESNSSANFRK